MFRKLAAAAAAPLAALAFTLPASAATHPGLTAPISATPVISSNGEAGYYAFAESHFKRIQGRFTLTEAATGLGAASGEGLQLCSSTEDLAAQVGARWNPGEGAFDILYATGGLSATTPNSHGTACTTGGALGSTSVLLPDVPAGDTVALSITNDGRGLMEFRAQDTTVNTGVSKAFAECRGLNYVDVASAGVVQNDVTALSAPAVIPVVQFRDTRVTLGNKAGTSNTLGRGHKKWTAVQVYNTANGTVSDPALLTPASSLNAGSFTVLSGSELGI
jgi:hypothetical protein